MRNILPEIAAALLFPLIIWQGKRTRRMTPRLPEAPGETTGVMTEDGRSLRTEEADLSLCMQVLGIGESPIAGVGVASQDQAVIAQFARILAQKLACPVAWQSCGKNGATVQHALTALMPTIKTRPVDIVIIGFGVNDTTAFHSPFQYQQALRQMIGEVRARLTPEVIVIASVPPLERFPALPWPLNKVLGLKARVLDRAAQSLVKDFPDVVHVMATMDMNDPKLMAMDGYHPSELGALVWARQMVRALT
jgi:lysophospholipase L1-like esterase